MWFITHVIQCYPVGVVQPQLGTATVLRDQGWCAVHLLNPVDHISQTFPGSLKNSKTYYTQFFVYFTVLNLSKNFTSGRKLFMFLLPYSYCKNKSTAIKTKGILAWLSINIDRHKHGKLAIYSFMFSLLWNYPVFLKYKVLNTVHAKLNLDFLK